MSHLLEALTFDDILIKPSASHILPEAACIHTPLTKNIKLKIPLISAAMDTLTESKMAILMAQYGGIGVIHKNLDISRQVKEVYKVKQYHSYMVTNPITIFPYQNIEEAQKIMNLNNISVLPVIEEKSNKLVGILTKRDIRFVSNKKQPISQSMTYQNLITVKNKVPITIAKHILHHHKIEQILVVDESYCCIGLITAKDLENINIDLDTCKNHKGLLRVGAAIGVGDHAIQRAEALVDADVDVLIIDTAHGHSKRVIDTLKYLKSLNFRNTDIIVGNVVTKEAVEVLIDSGADAIKVGIGPGSICTTRIVSGVGVPQVTALLECVDIAQKMNVPIISDGGIKYSGDIAKALAIGASSCMIGSLFAGTDETPGNILYNNKGLPYKDYRGMGSISAMINGSADRYYQENKKISNLIPEGVEGSVDYKGSCSNIILQLIGGLKSAMGYTGSQNLQELHTNSKLLRITRSGIDESHPHSLMAYTK